MEKKNPAFHECRACKIKVKLEKSITAYFPKASLLAGDRPEDYSKAPHRHN